MTADGKNHPGGIGALSCPGYYERRPRDARIGRLMPIFAVIVIVGAGGRGYAGEGGNPTRIDPESLVLLSYRIAQAVNDTAGVSRCRSLLRKLRGSAAVHELWRARSDAGSALPPSPRPAAQLPPRTLNSRRATWLPRRPP